MRGVTVAALVAGAAGVLTLQSGLLLLTLFGVTVAGCARLTTPPDATVEIDRTTNNPDPDSGETVTVTVSVTNTGERTLTDLRLVDGVPAGLTVTEGSPQFATALRPGKEATFSYSLRAACGVHEFDPALVVTRDATGVRKRETLVSGPPSRLTCLPVATRASDTHIQLRPTTRAGRTQSTQAGPGLAFHSVREYRPGDSRSRIDWRRTAKTGELTTVEFHESRRAEVLVAVDARAEAYLRLHSDGGRSKPLVRESVAAARHVVAQSLAAGLPVGVAALSPRACWIPPNVGDAHRRRIREALASSPAFAWEPPDADCDVTAAVRDLRQRANPDTHLVVVSPLCDDGAERAVRRLDAAGRAVTVVSPTPTAAGDAPLDCESGYALLARRSRIDDLRGQGVPVREWDPSDSVAEVVSRVR